MIPCTWPTTGSAYTSICLECHIRRPPKFKSKKLEGHELLLAPNHKQWHVHRQVPTIWSKAHLCCRTRTHCSTSTFQDLPEEKMDLNGFETLMGLRTENTNKDQGRCIRIRETNRKKVSYWFYTIKFHWQMITFVRLSVWSWQYFTVASGDWFIFSLPTHPLKVCVGSILSSTASQTYTLLQNPWPPLAPCKFLSCWVLPVWWLQTHICKVETKKWKQKHVTKVTEVSANDVDANLHGVFFRPKWIPFSCMRICAHII